MGNLTHLIVVLPTKSHQGVSSLRMAGMQLIFFEAILKTEALVSEMFCEMSGTVLVYEVR